MKRFTFTGESSAANTAHTHVLGISGDTEWVDIKSLTVSSRGGDISADVGVTIYDNNTERWTVWLRSAQIFGGHFPNIGIIPIKNNIMKIHTDAGGANVIVAVSCVYKCLKVTEAF